MQATVQIEGGPSFQVQPQDSLLSGALRAGIGFPYECCSGGCGSCRFEVVAGDAQERYLEAPGLTARERARGRKLACQTRVNGDCTIRVRTSAECVPMIRPVRLSATLTAVRDITHDLREFTFHSEVAAQFLPGQYAMLTAPGEDIARAYSMSNLPNQSGVWQFIVKRVPNGRFTRTLFDDLRAGAPLELDGPYGNAWFRCDNQRPIIGIAGGSGLAPVLSIARAAACDATARDIHLFYGGRSQADAFDAALLPIAQASRDAPSFVTAIAEPGPDWRGEQGFIHLLVESRFGAKLADFEFYFAGPPPMLAAIQEMLILKYQVPVGQMHFDRFF